MIVCDLCGQAKECQPKDIEGKEYDICSDCWNPLAEQLKGKGRTKKQRETVFLPSVTLEPKREEPNPLPGEPPKIWDRGAQVSSMEPIRPGSWDDANIPWN
jgi:ribosome-binding protein aMBF1 (putative translation factor)